jgi:hypothetical protein
MLNTVSPAFCITIHALGVKVNKREVVRIGPPTLAGSLLETPYKKTTPSLKGMTNSPCPGVGAEGASISSSFPYKKKNLPAQLNCPSRPLTYICSKSVSSSGILALTGISPLQGCFWNKACAGL